MLVIKIFLFDLFATERMNCFSAENEWLRPEAATTNEALRCRTESLFPTGLTAPFALRFYPPVFGFRRKKRVENKI